MVKRTSAAGVVAVWVATVPVFGQSIHHHGGGHHGHCIPIGGIGYPGVFNYWPPLIAGIGPAGPFAFAPVALVYAPTVVNAGTPVAGPWLPPTNPMPAPVAVQAPRRKDATKSGQLVTLGDRLFRAGNLKRAEDRYGLAAKAAPDSAAPYVRLAQVAFVRGRYGEAADFLREALTADPGWLAKAPDIQSIYAEPGDFARQIARLESHLQANPADRDAWLVLGAEWFLSGRSRQANDVFLRLTDRKPDAALAAFLDAAQPNDAVH